MIEDLGFNVIILATLICPEFLYFDIFSYGIGMTKHLQTLVSWLRRARQNSDSIGRYKRSVKNKSGWKRRSGKPKYFMYIECPIKYQQGRCEQSCVVIATDYVTWKRLVDKVKLSN